MSLQAWLDEGRLKEQPTRGPEIRALFAKFEERLQDAERDLSLDWRFAAAYDAARLLCTIVLRAAGYRASPGPGQHELTIRALPLIMGTAQVARTNYLDRCRRRRAAIIYEAQPRATREETAELLEELQRFRQKIEPWLRQHHPGLLKG